MRPTSGRFRRRRIGGAPLALVAVQLVGVVVHHGVAEAVCVALLVDGPPIAQHRQAKNEYKTWAESWQGSAWNIEATPNPGATKDALKATPEFQYAKVQTPPKDKGE